jgi:hypothetical protein
MIFAHTARETAAKDEGGSKKKGNRRREGGSKPKKPRLVLSSLYSPFAKKVSKRAAHRR